MHGHTHCTANATAVFLSNLWIFLEAATGSVLLKKLFLKILQYSQTEYCKIFKNTYFEKHLLMAASNFWKQL